jgi:hypothetical protein
LSYGQSKRPVARPHRPNTPARVGYDLASFRVVGFVARDLQEAIEHLQIILEPVIQFIQQLLAQFGNLGVRT